jgi:hypothetical protein
MAWARRAINRSPGRASDRRRDHAIADHRRGLPRRGAEQFVLGETRDRESQVDAVEKRSGELLPIAVLLIRATPTRPLRVAREPARARVGRRDERETSRERHRSTGVCHDDPAILERLAERFDGVAPELRQLVELAFLGRYQPPVPRLYPWGSTSRRIRLDGRPCSVRDRGGTAPLGN